MFYLKRVDDNAKNKYYTECAERVHLPASPDYQNWFPYDSDVWGCTEKLILVAAYL